MSEFCQHERVIVNYLGKWENGDDVPVAALQQQQSSIYMTLECPRCAICNASLGWRELKKRIQFKGDLFDARFIWGSIKPKWAFWRSASRFR